MQIKKRNFVIINTINVQFAGVISNELKRCSRHREEEEEEIVKSNHNKTLILRSPHVLKMKDTAVVTSDFLLSNANHSDSFPTIKLFFILSAYGISRFSNRSSIRIGQNAVIFAEISSALF